MFNTSEKPIHHSPIHSFSTISFNNYIKNQLNYMLILLVLCLLFTPVQSCLTIKSYDDNKSCIVCQNSTTFSCSYTDSNGQSTSLSSAYCSIQCCNSNMFANTASLYLCNTATTSTFDSNMNLATILIIVFFSIPATICAIIAIKTCYNNCRHQSETSQNDPPPISSINIAAINIDDFGPLYLDKSLNCSICLQGECNMRTKCGHSYHTPCLLAWIHKKQKCPLCVSREYNPILLYCTNCFKQIKISLLYQNMQAEEAEQWKNNATITCQLCLHSVSDDFISLNLDLPEEIIHNKQQQLKDDFGIKSTQSLKQIMPSQ